MDADKPGRLLSFLSLAVAIVALGVSVRSCQRADRLAGGEAIALLTRAAAAVERGDLDTVEAHLGQAAEMGTHPHLVSLVRGDLLSHRANLEGAAREYALAATRLPLGRLKLGLLRLEQGRYEEARHELEGAVSAGDQAQVPDGFRVDAAEARIALGRAYLRSQDLDLPERLREAESRCGSVSGQDEQNAEAHACLGAVYAAGREVLPAIKEFERAMELDPSEPRYRQKLAALLIEYRRPERAAEVLNEP